MPSRIGDALCWHATLASLSEMAHVCEQLAEQEWGLGPAFAARQSQLGYLYSSLDRFPAMARPLQTTGDPREMATSSHTRRFKY
jgi:hypothetical protein